MKSFQLLFYFSILSFSLCVTSCGSGASCNNFDQDWIDAVNKFSAIQTTYITNPTAANCEEYRTGYLEYIDSIEDLLECLGQATPDLDLDAFLEEAKFEVNNLEC